MNSSLSPTTAAGPRSSRDRKAPAADRDLPRRPPVALRHVHLISREATTTRLAPFPHAAMSPWRISSPVLSRAPAAEVCARHPGDRVERCHHIRHGGPRGPNLQREQLRPAARGGIGCPVAFSAAVLAASLVNATSTVSTCGLARVFSASCGSRAVVAIWAPATGTAAASRERGRAGFYIRLLPTSCCGTRGGTSPIVPRPGAGLAGPGWMANDMSWHRGTSPAECHITEAFPIFRRSSSLGAGSSVSLWRPAAAALREDSGVAGSLGVITAAPSRTSASCTVPAHTPMEKTAISRVGEGGVCFLVTDSSFQILRSRRKSGTNCSV